MSRFNERLRQLKEEAQLSAGDLSTFLGIKPSTLSYYLKDREPNYDTLMMIAGKFEVSVDWLIGHSDIRASTTNNASINKTIARMKEEDYKLGADINRDPAEQTLHFLLDNYPEDAETIEKEVKNFSKVEDSFFPNSKSLIGQIYDDTYLMYLIENVYKKFIACVVNYSTEADLPISLFNKNDILNIIDSFNVLTDTLHELMVNYTYHLATSIASDKCPVKDKEFINELTEFCLSQYHNRHPVDGTIYTYNLLFEDAFWN